MGVVIVVSGLISGCVSSEKYEAEKARALNFQRLLAQEEKRTGEINAKYQEVQQELTNIQSQNRDLTSELDTMRDQFTNTQDELTRLRDSKVDGAKADDLTLSEPSISEFGLEDIEFKDSDFADISADLSGDLGADLGEEPLSPSVMDSGNKSHTVAKGETLFSISRQYGISVNNLKSWNNLPSNLIKPGQKLVVSRP
ncbi:MAG: LysM peptidoglycan-binding domain-containing protein [Nitrospirales bacterium]|nr:LysM peptidoglycan-binding domain-containing protein [Nitrospira sp.]MDR4502903.1 LysM peptidoglycan-binding domain-containing protein [Nitrospirales bacterium]